MARRKSPGIPITCKKAKAEFDGKFGNRAGTGFVRDESDHFLFYLFIDDEQQDVHTSFSMGSKGKNKEVHSRVPNELGISQKFFIDMVRCRHELSDYLEERRKRKGLS